VIRNGAEERQAVQLLTAREFLSPKLGMQRAKNLFLRRVAVICPNCTFFLYFSSDNGQQVGNLCRRLAVRESALELVVALGSIAYVDAMDTTQRVE
jgi:hypothetical protein